MDCKKLTRRKFLELAGLAGVAAGMSNLLLKGKVSFADNIKTATLKKPNVLFIVIDDMNDWLGCLKGHPQVKTPNIDRLAKGSFLFTNAHCASPTCTPARVAMMTGVATHKSGVYSNKSIWWESPYLQGSVIMPENFKRHGYMIAESGKIIPLKDKNLWDQRMYYPNLKPPEDSLPLNHISGQGIFDWGPIDAEPEDMADWKTADFVSGILQKKHEKPFFVGCGFSRTHLSWYVPRKYYDLYPIDDLALPIVKEDDLKDLPVEGKSFARTKDHKVVTENGAWKSAVQSYLASISFVDDCVGRIVNALENSPNRDNTIVVLTSDHGFHLGEKIHWRKFSLWEESTRIPFLLKLPGMGEGMETDAPVGQVDMYPTLLELCGLEPPPQPLDGQSLVPLLRAPDMEWERPALTTFQKDNHGLRDRRWRYIHYNQGGEELYDHKKDPLEWNNLAGKLWYYPVKMSFSKNVPQVSAKPVKLRGT